MLNWLQSWYAQHCDGFWEHENKIVISSTDNPGWMITIDLNETKAEDIYMPYKLIEKSEDDWIGYLFENKQFKGGCSVQNLEKLIMGFKEHVL